MFSIDEGAYWWEWMFVIQVKLRLCMRCVSRRTYLFFTLRKVYPLILYTVCYLMQHSHCALLALHRQMQYSYIMFFADIKKTNVCHCLQCVTCDKIPCIFGGNSCWEAVCECVKCCEAMACLLPFNTICHGTEKSIYHVICYKVFGQLWCTRYRRHAIII